MNKDGGLAKLHSSVFFVCFFCLFFLTVLKKRKQRRRATLQLSLKGLEHKTTRETGQQLLNRPISTEGKKR